MKVAFIMMKNKYSKNLGTSNNYCNLLIFKDTYCIYERNVSYVHNVVNL